MVGMGCVVERTVEVSHGARNRLVSVPSDHATR